MTDSPKPHRKKLIEHSLPLDTINTASVQEKSVRHGHPFGIHLWWARRPLAAARAVLFAQLVDDPSSWPEVFATKEEQDRERRRLHEVISDIVTWPKTDKKSKSKFGDAINLARIEIARSVSRRLGESPPNFDDPKSVLTYLQKKGPPVYDPFCGGGSIPMEAQRLGLRSFGSDLNPVATLVSKASTELPVRFLNKRPVSASQSGALQTWMGAEGIAEDVRYYGLRLKDKAQSLIGHLYPKVSDDTGEEHTVVAWLWTRTVGSPDPSLKGAHVPLASSFVISSKKGKEAIVQAQPSASAQNGWEFRVKSSNITRQEMVEAKKGTKVGRGVFRCLLSGTSIDPQYIRSEGSKGRLRSRMMAIVAEGRSGRRFFAPSHEQEAAALSAKPDRGVDVPFFENALGFRIGNYGLSKWEDLFSDRQLVALGTLSDLVVEIRNEIVEDAQKTQRLGDRDKNAILENEIDAYADLIATYLGLLVSQIANHNSSNCGWNHPNTQMRSVFSRHALPMVWDYAEANVFSNSSGSYSNLWERQIKAISSIAESVGQASIGNLDAAKNGFPVRSAVISTDPPYFDNIGYADLSDFFYVWLKRSIGSIVPDLFRRVVTPKDNELVATPSRHGGKLGAEKHFLGGMKEALSAMRRSSGDWPITIYYAFKQSEAASEGLLSPGWSAFLEAVIQSGLQVDGTWPIRTEKQGRMRSNDSNALAASVVLVCRTRAESAPVVSKRDFLRELKPVMYDAILTHQKAGIPLPDRRQAGIGPGIGVFSKYSMVREPDDSPMSVATALALINKEIDSLLSEGTQELDPETRFALEWYQMHGYSDQKGRSGDAIAQLQAFNLSESRLNASGLFRSKGGDAKLLTREEMHDAIVDRLGKPWRPSLDDTFTVWELAQHMARALRAQNGGVDVAGRLLAERRECGPDVLLIAERLYELATTRGENDEALVWNELQTSWPQLESAADRAAEAGISPVPAQTELEF